MHNIANIWIELTCPNHGIERYKIKVIRKFNVQPEIILPKFRTRPKYGLSGLIVGRNVNPKEIADYIVQYYKQIGLMENITNIRLRT